MRLFFFIVSMGMSFGLLAKDPESFLVEAKTVQPLERFLIERRYIGTIGAEKFSYLAPKATGTVAEIAVKPGQRVKKGQILISLKGSYEAKISELAERNLSLKIEEFKRNQGLFPQDISKSQIQKMEQELVLAGSQREEQRRVLENVLVRAPFDGIAGVPLVGIGETVQAHNPVISLMETPFEIKINIPGSRLAEVKVGQPVRVKASSAIISAVERGIDPKTRTGFAKATLPSCDSCVINDSVYVHITVHEVPNAIVIDRNAIFYQRGKPHVVLIAKGRDNTLTADIKEVVLGIEQEGQVEVVAGLKALDEIVIANPKRVTQGALLKVVR